MKKPLFKLRQLLVLAYLLAAVFWVVRCLIGCGVMLNYQLQGKMPQTHLDAADLVTESFAPYSSNEWWTPPDDDPAWYLSTDSDPRIYWQGQGYIETVVLDAAHRLPPGGVALYYLKPGQTDYTEAQKVFARVTAPGVYTFDLGGKWVTGAAHRPRQCGRRADPVYRHRAEPRAAVVSAVCTLRRLVAGAGVWAGGSGGVLLPLCKKAVIGEGFIPPRGARWRRLPRRGQAPSLQTNVYGCPVGSGLDRSVPVCGNGKPHGRDESLPYSFFQNQENSMELLCVLFGRGRRCSAAARCLR